MHRKYAADGLAAVSVSLDDELDKPETREKIGKFLEKRQATCKNLVLNVEVDEWQKKLDVAGPPIIYVFDREGKWVKRFTGEFDFAEIERVALDLLNRGDKR